MAKARMPIQATDAQNSQVSSNGTTGLSFSATFCPPDVADPFETAEWELRSAEIKDETGNRLFEQRDCEVPTTWSQLACNVVINKYFYGEIDTSQRETSIRQLIHRVTRTISDWGLEDGYFASEQDGERFYRDLTWLCLHQHGAFNSPVWFNVGLHDQYEVQGAKCSWHWEQASGRAIQAENSYEFPQASACFIQSVDDTMEDIMRLAASEAMLFKFGSGTGTDLSTLRSCREKLSGGGTPSGPLSFMRVFDQIAGVVKSGGKTRRAAKMQSLQVWHPDILEFIESKWKEEQKAHALIDSGKYDANFNGEAYSSILFQNANLSVRVSDEFLQSVDRDGQWTTRWVTDPAVEGPSWQGRYLLDRMAECAWHCGDPGIQYDSTINRWHTCPNSGRINASNPCSEFMFLDDSACNLASLNLMKFQRADGSFDAERFQAACRIFIVAQDILVDRGSYPTEKIAEHSHRFRPLGLGYANLGGLLMSVGLPYDSELACSLCGCITAIMHATANLASIEMAEHFSPFEGYRANSEPMNRVMKRHRDALAAIHSDAPQDLRETAHRLWENVVERGPQHGFRNAQVTVLAPTGTIGFMMDCATTGIEPDIAIVKYKQLAGGGVLKIVNQTVPITLKALGYDAPLIDSIVEYVDENNTIEGAPDLLEEHLPVFDCAFQPTGGTRSISWRAHIRMMAAAQPFLSGAISKTVNMPNDVTPDEIADAYMWGWRMGLKAIAVYRDGSKQSQPLSTESEAQETESAQVTKPRRERLPDTRQSVTHKFSISGHEGYITVGLYPDNRPGELFIIMAKEGSTVGGLMDCFGTAISICLQYGVPLSVLVAKFSHTRFEPMGFTREPEIRVAKSLVDYIFRWLEIRFLPSDAEPFGKWDPSGEKSTPQGEVPADVVSLASELESADLEEASTTDDGRLGHQQSESAVQETHQVHNRDEQFAQFQIDAPSCDNCGAITVRNGNCYLCHNCGNSIGCS